MSRRKQANPRPLKALEDGISAQEDKVSYKLITATDLANNTRDDESMDSDPDDFDEYGPLVVDTSRQEPDDDETRDNKEQADCRLSADSPHLLSQTHLYNTTSNSEPFTLHGVSSHHAPTSPSEDSRKLCLPKDSEDSNSSHSHSRTPSISSLDQLSPGGLSSSISASKTHRRGKRNHSLDSEQEYESQDGDFTENKILPVASDTGDSRYICPICSEVLDSSHNLTVHIRTHNTTTSSTQANSCTICGKTLSSQSSLDRHMLVHSGERPFQCKYCKMSFTTNGNMHRHMRIHTKETEVGPMGVKVQRKRAPAWKPKINFVPIEPAPTKSPKGLAGLPLAHQPREITPDNYSPAKSFSFLNSTSTPKDAISIGMKRPFNFINCSPEWNVPAKQFKYDEMNGDISMEASPSLSHNSSNNAARNVHKNSSLQMVEGDEKDMDQLHCPVCSKTFLCKYGLESHLETHPNFTMKCTICQMAFPTLRGLNMHRMMIHSKAKTPSKEDAEQKEEVKSAAAAAVIGFYDLSFVDFSVKKFSLIAKSWCEGNARKSSSAYHNFMCKECAKAFPCKSALKLHMNTHSGEKTSQCPICDCDYMDTRELHMHMIKHMSDKTFADAQKPSNRRKVSNILSSKESKAEEIGQHDFLAAFGLTANVPSIIDLEKKPKGSAKSLDFTQDLDKKENNDYFAKLGQVFSPVVSALHKSKLKDSDEDTDFADVQKILQNTTSGILSGFPGSMANLEQLSALNPSQLSAFMPSLMQGAYGLSPSIPIPTMAAMINASHMMNSLSNHSASSSRHSTPTSSESGSCGVNSSLSPGDKGLFPCKYCDLVFPNYRALKGHTRTHLGLSPYKCNLCSYSSADKSTLIRHLRTHNGERPFQCMVCDFAFTTKANCERHVRKKHGKIMKDEIESAIGYNKYVSEQTNNLDNFHSPDTVCKYCGVDFKFFRALKHHLRSHSSCRQKPFQCTRCEVGFSTKANCIRHLQKQHTEISYNQIEQYIVVNEPSLLEDGDKSQGDSVSDDGMLSDTGRDTNTPLSMTGSNSQPPAAHSTPKLCMTPNSSRQGSPAIVIKTEPLDCDEEDDRPLDFSTKAGVSMPVSSSKKSASSSEELPMDLSIKKRPDSPSPVKTNSGPKVSYDNNLFQCQFCPKGFSNQRVIERHIWQHHPQVMEMSDKEKFLTGLPVLPKADNKLGILGNLKLPIKPPVNEISKVAEEKRAIIGSNTVVSSPKNLLKEKIKKEPRSPSSYGSDSNCDLASVTKILHTTNSNQFQVFLHENIGDSDSQGREEAVDEEDEDMEMPDTSDFDNEESPLTIIEEPPVESSIKRDNHRRNEIEEADMNHINRIISNELRQQIQKAKEAESAFSVPNRPQDKGAIQNLKKKRNSYADSPHKLHCPYCSRTFPWVSSLTRHLLTHTGQKPFKCPRCPVTFSTKSNRERHLIRKHGVNMLDPLSRQTMDRPYKCHLCVFSSFSTQGNLLKHYKERHNGCDLPESLVDLDKAVTIGLATTLTGEERIAARDRALGILDSDNTYAAEEQLNQSMENERPDDRFMTIESNCNDYEEEEEDISETSQSPVPRSLVIEDIPVTTNNKRFSGSAERQINPERDNYNVDKITECWKCSEKFVSRKLLVRHLKEHNIDLPFKCYLCDASFDIRRECLLHQEKFHGSDWNILKDKNKVDSIEDFSKHMDKVVENNCNKVDQGVLLEIPGQNADDPKMEVVSADYMQRKVYCSLCPKRFWSLQDLRRHMRSHTGERPFECDICQKRFTLKHSMMRHRKKHMESGSLSPSDDEDTAPTTTEIASTSLQPKPKGPRLLPKIPGIQPPLGQLSQIPSGIPILSHKIPISASTTLAAIPIIPAMPTIHLSSSSLAGDSLDVGLKTSSKQFKRSGTTPSASGVDSDSKDNDILHSLLGVEMGSIDKMLDSADSAAMLLGVQ